MSQNSSYLKRLLQSLKIWPDQVLYQQKLSLQINELNDIKNPKVLMGKIMSELNRTKGIVGSIHDVEFSVFSQWGDDGIIQYLINKLEIPNKTFIEFGVENYRESNTRFLVINNNWSGLVIDGSEDNIRYIQADSISWGYELHSMCAFITAENINQLITDFLKKGYHSEIGILSIDLDGNDYWIWKAIEVVQPIIVIIEYNSLLGIDKAYTIPYDAGFQRYAADPRLQYYGISLKAACILGGEKGYSFIGCNSNGNNAYFVRNDKLGSIPDIKLEDGYVLSKFREFYKGKERASGKDRLIALDQKPLFNVDTGKVEYFDVKNFNHKS